MNDSLLTATLEGLASHVQAKKNITRTRRFWVQLGSVDCFTNVDHIAQLAPKSNKVNYQKLALNFGMG